jgi:opacity protein-like surface antigen
MKKPVFAIALAMASLASAQAQTVTPNPMRVVMGVGITDGGDKLASAHFDDGTTVNIKAGKGVLLYGGIDYLVNNSFSFQGTFGYHIDDTPAATNGNVKFQRFPIELMAYVHPSVMWRIGGGVRYISSPKLKGRGFADGLDYKFDNAVSGVVEAEYFYNEDFGIKLRYVSEKFEKKGVPGTTSGNHVGLLANYYF